MARFFLFLLCLVTSAQASLFDWSPPISERMRKAQVTLEDLESSIHKALQDYQVPGIAIGVVVDGRLIYAKGFGVRDLETKLPITPDTLFAIGSCTKAFTSFLFGKLVDQGLVFWDDRIIDILPEFRLHDSYATQSVTLRDLLTHRSGMPRHEFMWYNAIWTRAEVLRRIRYLEPSFNLRERYQYNNLMYLVAGCVMEKLSGKSWEQLMRQEILDPLGMKRTCLSVGELQSRNNFAFPYLEKGETLTKMQFRDITLIGPAGSLNSSVNDLARWVSVHLSDGIHEGKSLIRPTTLQEMHTSQIVIPGSPDAKDSFLHAYGIGWRLASYRGYPISSHDGGIDGFTSVIALLPQQQVGVIVLANKNLTSLPRFLSFELIDKVLGLPSMGWLNQGVEGIQKAKKSAEEQQKNEHLLRKGGTNASHPLEHYAGIYHHPGYGSLTVEIEKDRLRATLHGLSFWLDHWHYDIFNIGGELQDMLVSRVGTKVTFRGNIQGEIEEVLIPLEPAVADIVFKKKGDPGHSSLAYLKKYVGLYEIYGYTVEIALRNETLCGLIPGQPIYELLPTACVNEFNVLSMTGTSVRFVMNPMGAPEEICLIQPYGVFTAKIKNRP